MAVFTQLFFDDLIAVDELSEAPGNSVVTGQTVGQRCSQCVIGIPKITQYLSQRE